MNKISSILVACNSLLWLCSSIPASWELLIPTAIFAACSIYLYKGNKIAKWCAFAFTSLNIWVNSVVIDLIEERYHPAYAVEVPVELQISTPLSVVTLLFLLASFWSPKSKSV